MKEAGRELDELVAEKVMGLVLLDFWAAPCPYCGDEMRFCGERSRCTTCSEWRYGPAKEYSDDFAAAGDVVEKLQPEWAWRIEGGGGNRAEACFWMGDTFHEAEAATVPHAICLAALKTVDTP